ncbi:MAG: amino acid adenylation domain-containing protein, partial [Clostridiaceae bacterium]|nr:amino acid adenylation domain-containing protein [Clostridiaceae bacterium]
TDLFYSREIDFIHAHLIQLLWHALDNPTRQLSKIHMLSQQEWDKVVLDFNRTDADYPRAETLVTLFERQAARTPAATALIYSDRSMNYAELNARANALAEKLKAAGVGREVIVAMLLQRSPAMLISILATLKAGGAYMPIDPDYPAGQIGYMLQDSQSRYLILDGTLPDDIEFDGTLIEVAFQGNADWAEVANPIPVNQPSDLAYVIYTSGSTGDPKGTMIEHRNVVRLLFNDRNLFDFSPEDTWTLFHSYCFDFSVWEMYGALLTGGRLVIVPKLTSRDPQAFLTLLAAHQVTILNQTPSAFYQLIEAGKQLEADRLKLRMVIFGGEALKPILLKPFRQRHPTVRLINMYGITETTVHVTFLEIEDDHIEKNSGNIGRPIPTTTIYILDSHLNPLPIGVAGEICVGGAGVGRGYLGKPELTASRFIPNPFKEGERLYRSGDQARYYAQGDLEYIGRIDNQVKIRGHRVELGEVEFKLLLHPAIREAVVLPQTSSAGNLQLYAWYVADQPIDTGQLADFLATRMPMYMLPACFIRVEQMPLTGNGKVDRRKLPEPDQDSFVRTPYEAARDEFEAKMVRIWEEILKLDRISINDNFFQIGGDSLSAVTAITMIGRGVTFTDLYQHPTIKSLSESIKKKQDLSDDRYLIRLGEAGTGSDGNLICFPYGGGNGPIYRELAEALTQINTDCCVYSINLPGHDLGSQQALRRLPDLAHDLSREIRETVTGEIIFYGHCVGSALALATARELEKLGRPVRQICVGGILPPRRRSLFPRMTDPWHLISDRYVLKFLGWIGLPVARIPEQQQRAILAAFRHDVREFYRYFQICRQQALPKISAPLCCIFGQKDVMTLNYRSSYKRWMQCADEVQMHEIAQAGHYFMQSHDAQLAGILAGYL